MTGVLLACLALLAGPLLARLLRGWPPALRLLDGFVLVGVAGLCLVHLLPEALATGHAAALPLAVLGFLLPAQAERAFHAGGHRRAHRPLLLLALAGLALHAALDGAALALDHPPGEVHGPHGGALERAILLHRLPTGLLLWLTMRPLFGALRAWGSLLLMVAATLAGHLASRQAAPAADSPWVADFLAFVAGGLLHVLIHQARPPGARGPHPAWGGLGALAGGLLLAAMSPGEAWRERAADATAWYLASYWPPVLLGGLLSLGLLLPVWRRGPRVEAGGYLRGLLQGLWTPVCSCGPGPLYEGELRDRAGRRGAAVAMLAAQVLRPEALLLLLALLGAGAALFWLGWMLLSLAVLGAFLARLPVRRLPGADPAATLRSLGRRQAFWDWLHFHAAWFAAGALLLLWYTGSLLAEGAAGRAADLGTGVLLCLVLLAAFLEIPATGAVFLLTLWASLFGGAAHGAASAMAWLCAAPLAGGSVRRAVARVHGEAAALALTALVLVLGLGAWGAASLLPGSFHPGQPAFPAALWTETLRGLLGRDGSGGGILAWLLPGAGAALGLLSLMTAGPRGWIAQVLGDAEHDHPHVPGQAHDHSGARQIQVDLATEAEAGE